MALTSTIRFLYHNLSKANDLDQFGPVCTCLHRFVWDFDSVCCVIFNPLAVSLIENASLSRYWIGICSHRYRSHNRANPDPGNNNPINNKLCAPWICAGLLLIAPFRSLIDRSFRWDGIQADGFRAKTICNVLSTFATKSQFWKTGNNRILRVFDGLLLATDQF